MQRKKLNEKEAAFIEGAGTPEEKSVKSEVKKDLKKIAAKEEKPEWTEKSDIKKAVTMNLYARLFQEFKLAVQVREEGRSASDLVNDYIIDYLGKK
jgi:hypothetical protein